MGVDAALVAYSRTHKIGKSALENLGDATSVGLAVLMLHQDEELGAALRAAVTNPTWEQNLALLACGDDQAADLIDSRLDAGDFEALNDVVRLGLGWEHPRIIEAMSNPATVYAASWLLVDSDPETYREWLQNETNAELISQSLLAPALLGQTEFFADALELYQDVHDDKFRRELAGILACISPVDIGREMLAGHISNDWLRGRRAMADFVHASGLRTWTATLALLDAADHSNPFELAASIAVSAGAVLSTPGDLDVAVLEEYYREQVDVRELSSRPEFGMAAALDDEDNLIELLVDAAAYELSHALEIETPGIIGLPLSGGVDAPGLDAARIFLEGQVDQESLIDELIVQVVQTLVQLRDAAVVGHDVSAVVSGCQALAKHRSGAVRAASADALAAMGVACEVELSPGLQALVGRSHGALAGDLSSIANLEKATEADLDWVAGRWFDGPVFRADLAAQRFAFLLEK